MPIATSAETDVRPARGRNPERGSSDASGFADAFRSLAKDGSRNADASGEPAAIAEDVERVEETATGTADAKADPRTTLLTLLSPLDRDGAARAEAGEPPARTVQGLSLAQDGTAESEDGAETETASLRISVVRRETHFEPTVHTPVVGDGELRLANTAQAVVAGAKDLAELLDTRVARSLAAAGEAGGAQEAVTFVAAAVAEARSSRVAANMGVEKGVANADAAAEKDGGEPDATADGVSALPDRARFDRRDGSSASNAVARSSFALREPDRQTGPGGLGLNTNMMPSVAAQVASTVIEALPDTLRAPPQEAPRSGSAFAPSEGGLRLRAGGAALKTLTIQLQPEHLGTLDVTMRLTDGRLALELAADKVETARMLSADRAGLRSLLEKAGFSIEDAAITVVAREAFGTSATRAPDQAQTPGDPSGSDTQRDGQSDSGAGKRGDGSATGRNPRHDPPETTERRSASGTVFL